MRRIGWLLAVLLGGLWLASEIPSSRTSSTPLHRYADPPVRWSRSNLAAAAPPFRQPALHPWVVAAEEALVSFLALAALPGRRAKLPRHA
jgi:hypothetical protein